MVSPQLTIGIPLRNEARYIRDTLQSLIDQPFRDFRVVISENCSEDDTYTFAREFADRDDRFELIQQPAKLTVIENFRFVLNVAQTPYFMWLGGHDLVCPNYLVKAMELLKADKQVSLVYPLVIPVDYSGKDIESQSPDLNDDLDTVGMTIVDRLTKVARNTFACYAFYGIMRTPDAKSIPFVKMIGPDHLAIFHLAASGHLVCLNEPGLQVRIHRTETYEEKTKRYLKEGVIRPDDFHPYENHALNYFFYIFKCSSLKFSERALLIYRLKSVFDAKFHVKLKGIVLLYLTKLFRF